MRSQERRDCIHYDECLDTAAEKNAQFVPCHVCKKFVSINDMDAIDLLNLVRQIFKKRLEFRQRWYYTQVVDAFDASVRLAIATLRKEKDNND